MPTFAFWHVNARVSPKMIADLAREWDVDVLALAEHEGDDEALRRVLNESTERLYFPDPGLSDRLTIFTRFPAEATRLVRDAPGIAIRHYGLPGDGVLAVLVHIP